MTHGRLREALALGPRELVAFVGGGGKTSALALLAEELRARGDRVLVGTTTAMRVTELAAIGPVLQEDTLDSLLGSLEKMLSCRQILAVAGPESTEGITRPAGEGGAESEAEARSLAGCAQHSEAKVKGLPVAWADAIWRRSPVDTFLVEADGSKGRSLKAFGPHEPAPPTQATTIVCVVGLDVLGAALIERSVHRAALLASLLEVPEGIMVTPKLVAETLRLQLVHVRSLLPCARVVVFVNKVYQPEEEKMGVAIAQDLLLTPRSYGCVVPDRVVVGDVRRRHFVALELHGGES